MSDLTTVDRCPATGAAHQAEPVVVDSLVEYLCAACGRSWDYPPGHGEL